MKTDQSFWLGTSDTVSVTESGRTNWTTGSRRGSWKLSEAVEMEEVAEAAETDSSSEQLQLKTCTGSSSASNLLKWKF